MIMIRPGISLIVLLAVSQQSTGQQTTKLENAFRESSVQALHAFVSGYVLSETTNSLDKTGSTVNHLVNTFINNYLAEPLKVNSWAYKQPGQMQKQYVILQPEVNVCFAASPGLDAIYRSGRRENLNAPLFENTDNVYGNFPTGGYLIVEKLCDCRMQRYSLVDRSFKKYRPVIADTALIHAINDFLHEDEQEYGNKVKFLTPFIPLYPGAQIHQLREDGSLEMNFYFSLYIHRIILDQNLERALIQYAFHGECREAYYQLETKNWEKVDDHSVLEF